MLTDPSLLRKLVSENQARVIPPGQIILDFHKYIRNIPIVLRGHVKVVGEDEEGNEILLYYIKPGESCVMSILGALTGSASKVKAVTISETEILFLSPESASRLIKEHPAWSEYIFTLYRTRFEELLQAVAKVSFKRLDERVLDLLEEKTRLFGSKNVQITHQQIAKEIGSPREAVSRVLKKMEREGRLRLGRGSITLS